MSTGLLERPDAAPTPRGGRQDIPSRRELRRADRHGSGPRTKLLDLASLDTEPIRTVPTPPARATADGFPEFGRGRAATPAWPLGDVVPEAPQPHELEDADELFATAAPATAHAAYSATSAPAPAAAPAAAPVEGAHRRPSRGLPLPRFTFSELSLPDFDLRWPAELGPRHARHLPDAGVFVAVAAVLVLVLEACAGIIPDDPAIGYLTPLRALIALGFAAALLTGPSLRAWRTPLDLPAAVLLLAAIPGARFAADFAAWRWLLSYVAVYYLAVFAMRRMRDLRESLGVLGLVAVAVPSLAAISQAAHGTPTGFCRAVLTGSGACEDPDALIRAVGTFANPNTLGAFLVLAIPFAVAFAMRAERTAARAIGWTVVGAGVLAIVLTYSRGPLAALAYGMLAYSALALPKPGRLRACGISTAAGLGLLALVALIAPTAVGVRWDVWRAAAAQMIRNPLGVGLQHGGEAIQEHLGHPDEAYVHAHDLWLSMGLETGWLGFAACIAITVLAALMVLRLARLGSTLAPVLGASLAGFAAASLVDHAANTSRVAIALAVVLAALAAEYGVPASLRRPLERRDDEERDSLLAG